MVEPSRAGAVAGIAARLVSGDVLNRVFRFVAALLLARTLTLGGFGTVNAVIAAAGLAMTVTTFGLADAGMREVAVREADAGRVAASVTRARVGAVAVVGGIALCVCLVLDPDLWSVALGGYVMALGLAGSVDWALRGLELARAHGLVWAGGGAVVLAVCAAVSLVDPSPEIAIWAFALGECTVAGASWFVLRRHVARTWPPVAVWPHVRRAWPLALAGIAVYVYTANVDTLLITASRGTREAGLYSAPYRVFWVLTAVIVLASHAALPTLSRHAEAGAAERVTAGVRKLALALVGYGLMVLGVAEALGSELLRAVFGSAFADTGPTFVLLVAGLLWYALGFPAGYSLVARDRFGGYLLGAVTALLVNLASNVVLIPPYGTEGAAVATLIAFIAASAVWLARAGYTKGWGRVFGLSVAATALAALAADASVPGGIAGGVTFAVGLVVAARQASAIRRSLSPSEAKS